MMTVVCVGLDIGSLNSCVAFIRHNEIDVIESEFGKRIFPTYVAFEERQRAFGPIAENQFLTYFENTVYNFKPLIGRKFTKKDVENFASRLSYHISLSNPDCRLQISIRTKAVNESFYPEQILAMYLNYIKTIIMERLNCDSIVLAINVPHSFTEEQRHALSSACKIAGLNNHKLIEETKAIVTLYGLNGPLLPLGNQSSLPVAFVSVGHIYTQVIVCAFNQERFRILSTASHGDLGGYHFDRVLYDIVCREFERQHGVKIAPHSYSAALLMTECVRVKEKQLNSRKTEISVNVTHIFGDIGLKTNIQRSEYLKLIQPFLDRLEETLKQCLRISGLEHDQIAFVELIGATCRITEVKEVISRVFGKEGRWTLNSDEAVARGCAIYAGMENEYLNVRNFELIESFAMLSNDQLRMFVDVENRLSQQDILERNLQAKANDVERELYNMIDKLKEKPWRWLSSTEIEAFMTYLKQGIEELRSPHQERTISVYQQLLDRRLSVKTELTSLNSKRQTFVNSLKQIINQLHSQNSKFQDALEDCGNFISSLDCQSFNGYKIVRGLVKFIGEKTEVESILTSLKTTSENLKTLKLIEGAQCTVLQNRKSRSEFLSFDKLKDKLYSEINCAQELYKKLWTQVVSLQEIILVVLHTCYGDKTAEVNMVNKAVFNTIKNCNKTVEELQKTKRQLQERWKKNMMDKAESQWDAQCGLLWTKLMNFSKYLQKCHLTSTLQDGIIQHIRKECTYVQSAFAKTWDQLNVFSSSLTKSSLDVWEPSMKNLQESFDRMNSLNQQLLDWQGPSGTQQNTKPSMKNLQESLDHMNSSNQQLLDWKGSSGTQQHTPLPGSARSLRIYQENPYHANGSQSQTLYLLLQNTITELSEACRESVDAMENLKSIYVNTVVEEWKDYTKQLLEDLHNFSDSWEKYTKLFTCTTLDKAKFWTSPNISFSRFCDARLNLISSMQALESTTNKWTNTAQTTALLDKGMVNQFEKQLRGTLTIVGDTLNGQILPVMECFVDNNNEFKQTKQTPRDVLETSTTSILKTWNSFITKTQEFQGAFENLQNDFNTYISAFDKPSDPQTLEQDWTIVGAIV